MEHEEERTARRPHHRCRLSSAPSDRPPGWPERSPGPRAPGLVGSGTRCGESSGSLRGAEAADGAGAPESGSDQGSRERTHLELGRDPSRGQASHGAARAHGARPAVAPEQQHLGGVLLARGEAGDIGAPAGERKLEGPVQVRTAVEAQEQPRLAQPEGGATLQLPAEVPEDEQRRRVPHQEHGGVGPHLAGRGEGPGLERLRSRRRAPRPSRRRRRRRRLEEALLDRDVGRRRRSGRRPSRARPGSVLRWGADRHASRGGLAGAPPGDALRRLRARRRGPGHSLASGPLVPGARRRARRGRPGRRGLAPDPSLAARGEVHHPDLASGVGDHRLGGVAQALERLAQRGLERLEKLGLGAESAVTLPEVLPRELPEPLHAQLLQVVHRSSEGCLPPRPRRLRVGDASGQRLLEHVSSSACCP